ncbi:hypothetical protein WN944_014774 [Citrus x changshan-huyou]|uniref:Uncharacterized protein n=1 Tax=Citrus x changshan-huyou TaxID=2935761 RepID=A0AAP0QQE8_9ROSI
MLGKIYLSSTNHHESVLTGEKKGVSGAEYHSFEKKVVDDSSKDRMELKIAELQYLNDNCKGFAESCEKLSSELEGARSGIVERNFRIAELERKVKEAEQEHLELLLLRQEKQEWEKAEGVLRKELAKEWESHRIAEEKLSTIEEVFYQASNAYMALYYRLGWRGGNYRNDVKPQEFDKSVGYELSWSLHYLGKAVSTIDLSEKCEISSDDDEDGYGEFLTRIQRMVRREVPVLVLQRVREVELYELVNFYLSLYLIMKDITFRIIYLELGIILVDEWLSLSME